MISSTELRISNPEQARITQLTAEAVGATGLFKGEQIPQEVNNFVGALVDFGTDKWNRLRPWDIQLAQEQEEGKQLAAFSAEAQAVIQSQIGKNGNVQESINMIVQNVIYLEGSNSSTMAEYLRKRSSATLYPTFQAPQRPRLDSGSVGSTRRY